jgi:putative heme iron utilization protein
MRASTIATLALTFVTTAWGAIAAAGDMCATPEQAQKVRAYYKDNPAAMPVIAARRLNLPESVVVSGLPADQVASAPGAAFTDVWNAMTQWKNSVFLIMKGDNVFEVLSPVAPVTPSKTSKYTNIDYVHPLRGHLRPDQYASIYAVAMPDKEGKLTRGVLFYDADGASVFGAFMSGEALPPPSAAEIGQFDGLMKLLEAKGQVCPAA